MGVCDRVFFILFLKDGCRMDWVERGFGVDVGVGVVEGCGRLGERGGDEVEFGLICGDMWGGKEASKIRLDRGFEEDGIFVDVKGGVFNGGERRKKGVV